MYVVVPAAVTGFSQAGLDRLACQGWRGGGHGLNEVGCPWVEREDGGPVAKMRRWELIGNGGGWKSTRRLRRCRPGAQVHECRGAAQMQAGRRWQKALRRGLEPSRANV